MSEFAHLQESKVSSKEIYDGQIIQVYVDTIALANGQQTTREVVRHCPCVAILAVTDEDKVVLVRQFRYPTDKPLLEVPAGKMDGDASETAEQTAARELAEETPYTASRLELIHNFYTAPGFCDEYMYLYRAYGLKMNSELKPDEGEVVDTVLYTREEALQALRNKEIEDIKTIAALQHWLLEC
ncbi:NUDIX hydrolase [Oligella urethralis]|uniref:NUDIX hydrolase n=1 Tax=Oligella urethralis TaxID=90245 RepID=UPI000362D2A2|nr:NUDIX hydrolase [Oligella urethralis]SUA68536.1 ADP-ribose pyrophosphatase [Oligella urethralis]